MNIKQPQSDKILICSMMTALMLLLKYQMSKCFKVVFNIVNQLWYDKNFKKRLYPAKKKKKKSPSFECPCFARSPGMSSAHVGHVGISIDHSRAFFTHALTCWSLYILSSLHQEDHRCTSLAMLELMTNDAYLSLG